MHALLFMLGNFIAIIGGFIALFWVMTSRRFYWRRRRRGIAALVFIAVGLFLMYSGSEPDAVRGASGAVTVPIGGA